MNNNRIFLFDSTLRDGAQTLGVNFSAVDKANIATDLDTLGIDYIEGMARANLLTTTFSNQPTLSNAKLTVI